MQLSGAYSGMSDSALDDLYEKTFKAREAAIGRAKIPLTQTLSDLSSEILDRLSSVRSFVTGSFGVTRFPKYDTLSTFHQVAAAQSSLKDSASNVAAAVKFGIGGLAVAGVGIVALLLYLRSKK